MLVRSFVALILLHAPLDAHAQSEAALREFFEGQTVTLKMAMPGAEDGVDVYPPPRLPPQTVRHRAPFG